MANEKRLIDANALRSQFPGSGNFAHDLWHYTGIWAYIDCTPTVDAVEVVHGRWEWITEDIYGCTNCGATNHVKEVMGQPDFNYCPNCGAKMDGDGNG